jgi:hypothetical protein
MIAGYSDRVNHALAFAAKHHDQQVRKGTRLPYLTHPANVALILCRYGQDEETLVAGILHDVIEDCVRSEYSREMLESRIGSKFGDGVLEAALAVTKRSRDDDGMPLSPEEVRADYIARIADAPPRARWVCAADKLHNASSILADLRRTEFPDLVWERFRQGRQGTILWYRQVHDRLREVGFDEPIMRELGDAVVALEAYAGPESRRTEARRSTSR